MYTPWREYIIPNGIVYALLCDLNLKLISWIPSSALGLDLYLFQEKIHFMGNSPDKSSFIWERNI